MRTSLVFLGLLSAVLGTQHAMTRTTLDTDNPTASTSIQKKAQPAKWHLTLLGEPSQCYFSLAPETNAIVKTKALDNCNTIIPELHDLASIKQNPNGDTVLLDKNGNRIVEFIETESTLHESIWPKYPLMTLAKIN